MTHLRNLFDDLVRVKALLWSAIDRGLLDAGMLGLAPLSMLSTIDSMGRCRVQDLAIDAVITAGGASQAVDRLEKLGLCRRMTNPEDRRSSLVELTSAGRAAVAEANEVFDDLLESQLASVGAAERESLAHTLRSLRAASDREAGR